MSEIAKIQNKLLQSLLSCNVDKNSVVKELKGINPQERLSIYRNNILENLTNNLKITYPGIWKLIGDECARGLSLSYIHHFSHLTSRGKINEFGSALPKYISSFPSLKHLTYLADFAKLEWLKNLSMDAENEKIITENDFAKIDLKNIENYHFIFNSSVCFLQSKFPLMQIQNLLENENTSSVSFNKDKTYLILYRFKGQVVTSSVCASIWHFLHNLYNKMSLGESLSQCEILGLEINIEQVFKYIFIHKMITDITS